MDIALEVKKVIEKVIIDNNYILDSVEYVKEGSSMFLRIVIDRGKFSWLNTQWMPWSFHSVKHIYH